MVKVKVTFTLDDETVARLRRVASRLGKPQSYVVRESIKEYEARRDKLSEDEKQRILKSLDAYFAKNPPRPPHEVDAELKALRASRRRWGRRHPAPGSS